MRIKAISIFSLEYIETWSHRYAFGINKDNTDQYTLFDKYAQIQQALK